MPTEIVHTDPIIETPALFTRTDTSILAKILPSAIMKKNSKDTTKIRKTKQIIKKISDVTGLSLGQIS
jgi:hypothetical protein